MYLNRMNSTRPIIIYFLYESDTGKNIKFLGKLNQVRFYTPEINDSVT